VHCRQVEALITTRNKIYYPPPTNRISKKERERERERVEEKKIGSLSIPVATRKQKND